MARVPILLAVEQQVDFEFGKTSKAIQLNGALANSPGLWQKVSGLAQWFRLDCRLSPRLRELVILVVGYEAPCKYVVAQHVPIAFAAGVEPAELAALPQNLLDPSPAGPFAPRESVALQVARSIVRSDQVPDDGWRALVSEYTDAEVVELCSLVAFYRMTATLARVWQLEVESDQLEYTARFPIG